jgi:hypothetical protein
MFFLSKYISIYFYYHNNKNNSIFYKDDYSLSIHDAVKTRLYLFELNAFFLFENSLFKEKN